MRKLVVESRTVAGDVIATFGDVVIVSFASPVGDAHLTEAIPIVERELTAGPRAVLVCMWPGMREVSEELTKQMADVFLRHSANLLGTVTVLLLNKGFIAAGVRSVITRARMRVGIGYDRATLSELGEAVEWIAERTPHLVGGDLFAAVRSLEPPAAG